MNRKMQRGIAAVSMAVAGVIAAAAPEARGDVIQWSSTSGSAWLTGGNWTGGVVPGAADTAQFGVNPTSATQGSGINFNNVTNNGTGGQIVGAINITSARTNNFLVGNSSSTVGAHGTLTLAVQTINSIADTIIRHNGGTVASPTTFTIQNTQGSGTQTMALALGPNNSIVQILTGNGSTGSTNGNTVLITSNITGAGKAITLLGGGSINNFGATLSLGGSNSFDGGITIGLADGTNSGRVLINNTAALPTSGNFTVNPTSQLRLQANGTYGSSAQVATLNSLGMSSGGVAVTNGALRYDPTVGGSATFLPAIQLTGHSAIHVTGETNTFTLSGPISGNFGIFKTGLGVLELGGASSYTGDTVIRGTVRIVAGAQRLPAGTRVELGQPASANLGILDLNGFNQQVAGLDSVSGTNATANKNTVTSAGPATLTLGGAGSYGFGSGSSANSGVITGAISLLKTGSGTQLLGDANTYTGSTTISGGTLILGPAASFNNSPVISLEGGALDFSSKSSFAIGASQTLRGAGSVAGATGTTTINGALQVGQSHDAPGSPASLSIANGTLVLSGEVLFDLFDTVGGADSLTASALTYGGVLKVANQTGVTLADGMSWDLFSFGGAPTGTFANAFGDSDPNLPLLSSGLEWSFDYGTGVLSVVPEPAGAGALALLSVLALRRRRG